MRVVMLQDAHLHLTGRSARDALVVIASASRARPPGAVLGRAIDELAETLALGGALSLDVRARANLALVADSVLAHATDPSRARAAAAVLAELERVAVDWAPAEG